MGRVASTIVCAVLAAATASQTPTRPARYQAVLLHPPGAWASRAFACGGGVQAGATYAETGAQDRAIVWSGAPDRTIDLTPPGYQTGVVYATDGFRQVGFVQAIPFGSVIKAALWYGSPESFVDLHPLGWETSFAEGVSGGRQIGWGITAAGRGRALLWSGTRESMVDITPVGYRGAVAYGISGNFVVGNGTRDPLQYGLALLWDLESGAIVELNPRPYGATAFSVASGEQVGIVTDPSTLQPHASLWRGSADSWADLHPPLYYRSEALATNGRQQVGYARPTTIPRACVWGGNQASYHDLHQYLPVSGGFTGSIAEAVDIHGNIAGYAFNELSGSSRAVLWREVRVPARTSYQ